MKKLLVGLAISVFTTSAQAGLKMNIPENFWDNNNNNTVSLASEFLSSCKVSHVTLTGAVYHKNRTYKSRGKIHQYNEVNPGAFIHINCDNNPANTGVIGCFENSKNEFSCFIASEKKFSRTKELGGLRPSLMAGILFKGYDGLREKIGRKYLNGAEIAPMVALNAKFDQLSLKYDDIEFSPKFSVSQGVHGPFAGLSIELRWQ